MPNISISNWSSYMQCISDDTQRLLAIDKQGHIHLIDRKNPPKGYKRLPLDQIISITLEVFENSNNISESDRSRITNGLNALIVRRRAKYKELHSIRKFFAGKHTKRRIEEDVKKTNCVKSLIHEGHKRTNQILGDFEQEPPPELAPEAIEASIATLIKDRKITDFEANHSTLYKMCEEAANKYFAKNDIHGAFRVRMFVAEQLGPTPPLKDISSLDDHHLDSLDTDVLKNGSLHVKKMIIDGKPYNRLMFRITPHEQRRLNTTIAKLGKESNRRKALQLLPENFCDDLQVKSRGVGATTDIRFGDVGSIKIGSNSDVYTHYNKVQVFVRADSGDIEKKAHTMLSAAGLGGVLFSQSQIDERMKIFHLLRYFHPTEARTFETNPYYFSIHPYHLQRSITAKIPSMKEVFMKYLVDDPELMHKQEIYPGKEVWAIKSSNQLLRDFEQAIRPKWAPEVIEATISTLIKDQKITDTEANHSTLYAMCEEAANKYFAKNDIHGAFRVRMLVAKQLGPTPRLKNISSLDNHHLDSLDTGVLKNGSLHVKKMIINGKPYTRLMFKVNNHERRRLNTTIAKLREESNRRKALQLLPENFCDDLQVKSQSDGYYRLQSDNTFRSKDFYTLGTSTDIRFGDVGSIKIGSNSGVYTHYNRVQVFIPDDSGDIEKKAHTMLSAVGLGGVLFSQRQMDDERMKIFHLLRYFHPREARTFETHPHYFSMSPDHLQRDIITKIPCMKEVFIKYLVDDPELMYKQEIYPGKEVWAIKGEADSIRRVGGIGLMAGIGSSGLKKNAYETVAKMLEHGALSSQDRFENGWIVEGVCSSSNLKTGGGDQVYTRMITKNSIHDKFKIENYPWYGQVQVLYDLKVLERGGYAYGERNQGSKQYQYENRSTFSSLTKRLHANPRSFIGMSQTNEFMVKNRIPPKYIKGLVVQTEKDKIALLETLKKAGRIEERDGHDFIKDLDIPIENFIHVAKSFTIDMWGVPEKELPKTEWETEVVSTTKVEGFPASLQDVDIINKSIGGSTGAQLVGTDEKKWVSKTGLSPSHCLNEYHANKAYKALGIRSPEVKVYWKSSKNAIIHGETVEKQQVVMLSQYIAGISLKKYLYKCSLDKKMELYRKIQENFVADCLFANWDVVGNARENILVDKMGNPWRIDNGGALEYRARGGSKGNQWVSEVKELTSLRNPNINPQTAEVFAGISDQAIIEQINEIVAKKEELLSAIPERLKRVMTKRIEYLIQYRDQLEMKKDERNEQIQEQLDEAKSIVIFDKRYASDKLTLNGTSLKSTPARDWEKIQDVDIEEPPYQKKKDYKVSAGVIIQEPDGRYWLFEPKGHYGGYEHTFPKGRQEKGLTMQQTALKEAWEESGLHVEITNFLCDQTRGTTHTRYYLAKRLSGDPSDAHWESARVKLVPKDQLHKLLNKKYDKKLLKQLGG